MKKVLIIASLLVAGLLVACGPTTDQAIDYNDKIIKEQVDIIYTLDILDASFNNYDVPEEMNAALEASFDQVETATLKVKEMEAFDGSLEFRDAAIELFATYEDALKNEYTQMVQIYSLPESEYTTEKEAEFNQLYSALNAKFEKAMNDFESVQLKFAEKYHFVLEYKF